MTTISHSHNRWRGRESILRSENAQTSLTVTVFIMDKKDLVMLQNLNRFNWVADTTKTWQQSELRSDTHLRIPTTARD